MRLSRLCFAITLLAIALAACSGGGSTPGLPGNVLTRAVPSSTPRSVSSTAPTPVPSGDPTVPPTVLAHSHTMEAANGTSAQYNSSFGFGNWGYVKPYEDIVMAGTGQTYQNVIAGGIASAAYYDFSACSGSGLFQPNQYASPDCTNWPGNAFYAQPGEPGNILQSGGTITQLVGDPGSSALQQSVTAELTGIQQSTPQTMIEFDDASPPDEASAGGDRMCWGLGQQVQGGWSCAGAPGGTASSPWGATFNRQEWIAGYVSIMANSPIPVMMNSIGPGLKNGTQAAGVTAVLQSPTAWGASCDWCFYHQNKWLYTSPLLDYQLDDMIDIIAQGKNVALVAESSDDVPSRMRALALEMLVYDPNHSWIWGSACGGSSYINACPESAWTFYGPLRGYPRSTNDLRDPAGNGGYVREFAYCYAWGKPVGPCATVVNPDTYHSHPLPKTTGTYKHTAQIFGDSLCACYGSSGSVGELGLAAPSTMPAASQFILFQ